MKRVFTVLLLLVTLASTDACKVAERTEEGTQVRFTLESFDRFGREISREIEFKVTAVGVGQEAHLSGSPQVVTGTQPPGARTPHTETVRLTQGVVGTSMTAVMYGWAGDKLFCHVVSRGVTYHDVFSDIPKTVKGRSTTRVHCFFP